MQHELVLDKIFKKEKIKNKYESLVVLTNDDSYLKFKKSENDYKSKIIRNDKIIEVLSKKEEKKHRIRDEEQVKNICDMILKYDISSTESKESLINELKEWRRKMSYLEGIEAYKIFTDATLEELSLKKPTTLEQLKEINGFQDYKVNKYGNQIINILNKK